MKSKSVIQFALTAEQALAEAIERNEIENEILCGNSSDEAHLIEGLDKVDYVLEIWVFCS